MNFEPTRIIVFGTFDPLHQGHHHFLRAAKQQGQHLTVIVARDSSIKQQKNRLPHQAEDARLAAVQAVPEVDQALLGDEQPDQYHTLAEQDFDIIALGHDQQPDDQTVRHLLDLYEHPDARIIRLPAHQPERYSSTRLRQQQQRRYDLHLHSTYSDGDYSPTAVVQEAANRHLVGVSLTDHNGLWGSAEAATTAHERGLDYIEGIEISARYHTVDVHVLGYSRRFDQPRLDQGLATTRAGYQQRMHQMVERCQAAGYTGVTIEGVAALREQQVNPIYMSYDVARILATQHNLSPEQARRLTTSGGTCHVPYGDWALTPVQAVELIHQAGGVAVLAHAGTIAYESDQVTMLQLIDELADQQLDGLEIAHQFHNPAMQRTLQEQAAAHGLLSVGGSDWHGPGRYRDVLGHIGTTPEQWHHLLATIDQVATPATRQQA